MNKKSVSTPFLTYFHKKPTVPSRGEHRRFRQLHPTPIDRLEKISSNSRSLVSLDLIEELNFPTNRTTKHPKTNYIADFAGPKSVRVQFEKIFSNSLKKFSVTVGTCHPQIQSENSNFRLIKRLNIPSFQI